jgi:small multidrug resistance pump
MKSNINTNNHSPNRPMPWLYLVLAIIFEVSGTTCMKLSEGFTRIVPTLFIFIFYALSFTFVTLTVKVLPLGLTYAVWSAIGTASITIVGIFWFGEGINIVKTISLLFIIIGVVGLHFSQEHLQ